MASKIHSPCAGNDGWSTTLWWDDAVVVFVLALIIPIDVSAVLRKCFFFSFPFILPWLEKMREREMLILDQSVMPESELMCGLYRLKISRGF